MRSKALSTNLSGSLRAGLRPNRILRCLQRWVTQVCDPVRLLRGLQGLRWFLADWRTYARLPGAEKISWIDTWPQVHDRTGTTAFDAHYYYANGWAARRILARPPGRHVDVGSLAVFANLLSAVVPVIFVDYRPLQARLSGLHCVGASLLRLPFADRSLASVSCLHVAEHVGLGRYGDPLNPRGTLLAADELARVLAPGGVLYLAVPVGRPRLCFNGCRIHSANSIRKYFAELQLIEYSGVDDWGQFRERVDLEEFAQCDYACGMFFFQKPPAAGDRDEAQG
jgi:SAM-dependent methyltransferase